MANLKKWIAAGFDRVYYGAIDSAGYLIGSTATAPAAGNATGSAMAKLDGAKAANVSVVAPDVVTITGDDGALGSFTFAPSELPTFTLEMGTLDLDFDALVQGTLAYDDGDATFGSLQPDTPSYADMCLLLIRQSKSRASGSVGSSNFEHLLIPKANIVPLGGGNFTERAGASYSYQVICNPTDKYPWGLSFSESNNGTTMMPIAPFSDSYRVLPQRWTGNNSATVFTLANTSVAASAASVRVYVNGVKQSYTTHYTVSGASITFGTAPAASAKIVVHAQFAA